MSTIHQLTRPVTSETREDGARWLIDADGRELSQVSAGYTIVQNAEILNPLVDRFGRDNLKKLVEYGRGKYMHAEIETGREFSFNYNGQNDVIRERIIIENSYNKTRSFRFMAGAFRMVCANGMYTGVAFTAVRRAHVGNIPVGDIVRGVIDNYENNTFDLWRRFQEKPMTKEEEIELVYNFSAFDPGTDEAPNLCARKTNDRIRYAARYFIGRDESLDNQRNAWGLYNGLNRGIANTCRGKSNIQRVIAANVSAETFLKSRLS